LEANALVPPEETFDDQERRRDKFARFSVEAEDGRNAEADLSIRRLKTTLGKYRHELNRCLKKKRLFSARAATPAEPASQRTMVLSQRREDLTDDASATPPASLQPTEKAHLTEEQPTDRKPIVCYGCG